MSQVIAKTKKIKLVYIFSSHEIRFRAEELRYVIYVEPKKSNRVTFMSIFMGIFSIEFNIQKRRQYKITLCWCSINMTVNQSLPYKHKTRIRRDRDRFSQSAQITLLYTSEWEKWNNRRKTRFIIHLFWVSIHLPGHSMS